MDLFNHHPLYPWKALDITILIFQGKQGYKSNELILTLSAKQIRRIWSVPSH